MFSKISERTKRDSGRLEGKRSKRTKGRKGVVLSVDLEVIGHARGNLHAERGGEWQTQSLNEKEYKTGGTIKKSRAKSFIGRR